MNFVALLDRLLDDTTVVVPGIFGPEVVLCATIVLLLLVRLVGADRFTPPYWVALLGTLGAFSIAYVQFVDLQSAANAGPEFYFTGLLVHDRFSVYFRLFLLLFDVLVIALTVLGGIPDHEDGPDFYTLLLGSTIGMLLMTSANHLLVLFLAVEMTSVPSYVMVGFLKGRRSGSEAALKYVVYGAGAAGVMLYGASLLAGLLGTGFLVSPDGNPHAPGLAGQLALLLEGQAVTASGATVRTVLLAVLMVLVGLAFKLSLFPFHFWCPDAFEGAPAEVAGFLSVGSKAAAFALLVRFCLALVGPHPSHAAEISTALGIGLGVVAAVTATYGNLAAYSQTNVKRLLAYSTIAHAGYMLMAVAALMVLLPGTDGTGGAEALDAANRCLEGLVYYLSVYLFMNLGAFAVVALLRNRIFSEEIADYEGVGYQAPVLCACLLVCFFSLVGLPPFGGFFAKFAIFYGLFQAGWVHWSMWVVLVVGGANTVFSLFYYVRVLKAMFLSPRPEGARSAEIPANAAPTFYALLVSLPVLALGVAVEPVSRTAADVSAVLLPQSAPPAAAAAAKSPESEARRDAPAAVRPGA